MPPRKVYQYLCFLILLECTIFLYQHWLPELFFFLKLCLMCVLKIQKSSHTGFPHKLALWPWTSDHLSLGLQYLYLSNEGVNSHRILLVASDRCQIQLAYGNNHYLSVHVNCEVRRRNSGTAASRNSKNILKKWLFLSCRGSVLVCFLGRHPPGNHLWHSQADILPA